MRVKYVAPFFAFLVEAFPTLGSALLVALLISCSSVPPICRVPGARDAGVSQAMRGEEYSEAQGGVCEDEHRNVFKTHFQAGYQEGKARYCSSSTVENTGLAHGQEGKRPEFSESNFRICDTHAGLKAAYLRGHENGLQRFCDETRSNQVGQSVGEAGRPADFSDAPFAICGVAKGKKIHNAYNAGYQIGLAKFCTTAGADAQGLQDGTQGAEVSDISGKYQVCGSAKATQIGRAYVEAYGRGFARYCSAESIAVKAKEQAQTSSAAVFPQPFEKCLNKYPELNIQFVSVFRDERKRVVEGSCTFNRGVSEGQKDAERISDKVTTMPVFCDAQLFSMYFAGYLEGWKQTKDRLCNTIEAYKQGVQAGAAGQPLSYTPPGNCPGDYQQSLSQKFTEGYYFGASQRPPTNNGGIAYGNGAQVACRSNLDCQSGRLCRNRGDGLTVCMGRGGPGFYCIAGSDCTVGLVCGSWPQNPVLRICQ